MNDALVVWDYDDAGKPTTKFDLSRVEGLFEKHLTPDKVTALRGWIADLRGKYLDRQCRQSLSVLGLADDERSFCCLGVAEDRRGECEWVLDADVWGVKVLEDPLDYGFEGEVGEEWVPFYYHLDNLTEAGRKQYGLRTNGGEFYVTAINQEGYPTRKSFSMIHLNDVEEWDFSQIADFLEVNLEGHLG